MTSTPIGLDLEQMEEQLRLYSAITAKGGVITSLRGPVADDGTSAWIDASTRGQVVYVFVDPKGVRRQMVGGIRWVIGNWGNTLTITP